MIKEIRDKDLNYKVFDLLKFTRNLIDLETKSKQPKEQILNYFKDIELILFTLYLEQIKEISEQKYKELIAKGYKFKNEIK